MLPVGADVDVFQLHPQVGTVENRFAPRRADVARADQIPFRINAHVPHHGEEELEGQSSAVGDGREEQAGEAFMTWGTTAVRAFDSLGRLLLTVRRVVHRPGSITSQLSGAHSAVGRADGRLTTHASALGVRPRGSDNTAPMVAG